MTWNAPRRGITRPDTRWTPRSSAYAGDHMRNEREHDDAPESWMGRLAGHTVELSHPGFDPATHANGGWANRPRNHVVCMKLFEEDAGPARHPFQKADTEKARCANTGLLRSSFGLDAFRIAIGSFPNRLIAARNLQETLLSPPREGSVYPRVACILGTPPRCVKKSQVITQSLPRTGSV